MDNGMTGARGKLQLAAGPAILLVGALIPVLRPVVAILLLVGWAALEWRRRPESIAWAAMLPVGLVLPWPSILGPDAPLGAPACVEPLSAIVVRRVLVAAAGLGLVAVLARVHGSGLVELGVRRPTRTEAGIAVAAAVAVALAGLVVGPWLARPFFGELDFPRPAAALLPALAFGLANGVLEEVSYRGAMQAWLGRGAPVALAIGFQGLAFGIVHAGPEVVALVPVHIALMSAVGVVGGLARARLGSLWLPIGVHVGADIALYVGLACRAA
jgi:membrane protease YdiL (CAAX protease family)